MPLLLPLMGIKRKASLETKEAFSYVIIYVLFYGHRLGEVSWLVHVATTEDGDVIGQQL